MRLNGFSVPVKRVTLFSGHYGSGKTNIAVSYAIDVKKNGDDCVIVDLDIVNPYFRTKDSAKRLKAAGVETVFPAYANSNVDLPALPKEIYGAVCDKSRKVVLDIGGDDRGALALGRYAPDILEENDYEMIFVANFYRPLTRSAEAALEVMREIEAAGKIPFTAIINNSNVAEETTLETVLATRKEAEKLSKLSGLPVIATVAEKKIAEKIVGAYPIGLEEKYFEIKGE